MKVIFHPAEPGRLHIQVLRAIYSTERRWEWGGIVKTNWGRVEKKKTHIRTFLVASETLSATFFSFLRSNKMDAIVFVFLFLDDGNLLINQGMPLQSFEQRDNKGEKHMHYSLREPFHFVLTLKVPNIKVLV